MQFTLSSVKTFFCSSGIKAQEPHKQKTNHAANQPILKLPSIKRPQVPKAGIQPLVDLNCIRELRSQVWDLQQQLSEAKTENKLLKRIQHRHMVALQRFENSERSISQVGITAQISIIASKRTTSNGYSYFKVSCSLVPLYRQKIVFSPL